MLLARDRLLLVVVLLAAAAASAYAGHFPVVSYVAGAAGLVAVHERLRRDFDRTVAVTSSLLLLGGTSLVWSMSRETSALDAATFALVAVLLLLAGRFETHRAPAFAIYAAVAVVPIGLRAFFVQSPDPAETSRAYDGWSAALFSSSHGLLSLTPIAYVALIGMFAYLRRKPVWVATALAILALWIARTAMMPTPGTTDRPFAHGLTAALALLAPGLAFVIDRARSRPWLAVVPLVAAAVVWNYLLMVQYTIGMVPKDAPVSFGALVRQQADISTRAPYVYPFAFPANVVFALREGVPLDRYEVLAFEPRQQSLDLAMDRRATRFLMDGWQVAGPGDAAPVQWIRDRRATLVVPLELPPGRDVQVIVTARARLEEPAVNATLGLEINGHEVGRFVVPPSAPLDASITVPAAAVGRVWRAGYNRVTFVSYSVERADPSDQRPAGSLGSREGNRAWPVAIHRVRIQPV